MLSHLAAADVANSQVGAFADPRSSSVKVSNAALLEIISADRKKAAGKYPAAIRAQNS
jgi:hypothetical protein